MDQLTVSIFALSILYGLLTVFIELLKSKESGRFWQMFFTLLREGVVAILFLVPGLVLNNVYAIILCMIARCLFVLKAKENLNKMTFENMLPSCQGNQRISGVIKLYEKLSSTQYMNSVSELIVYWLIAQIFGVMQIREWMLSSAFIYSFTFPIVFLVYGKVIVCVAQKHMRRLCKK